MKVPGSSESEGLCLLWQMVPGAALVILANPARSSVFLTSSERKHRNLDPDCVYVCTPGVHRCRLGLIRVREVGGMSRDTDHVSANCIQVVLDLQQFA